MSRRNLSSFIPLRNGKVREALPEPQSNMPNEEITTQIKHTYIHQDVKYPFFQGNFNELESWFHNAESIAKSRSTSSNGPSDIEFINCARNLIDHKSTSKAASICKLKEVQAIDSWDKYKSVWRKACRTETRPDVFSTFLNVTKLQLDVSNQESPITFISRLEGVIETFVTALEASTWTNVKDAKDNKGITVDSLGKLLKFSFIINEIPISVKDKLLTDNVLQPDLLLVDLIEKIQDRGGFGPLTSNINRVATGQVTGTRGNKKKKTTNVKEDDNLTGRDKPVPNSPSNYTSSCRVVCHHCFEEGHIRPYCPKMNRVLPRQERDMSTSGNRSTERTAAQTGNTFCTIHNSRTHSNAECRNYKGNTRKLTALKPPQYAPPHPRYAYPPPSHPHFTPPATVPTATSQPTVRVTQKQESGTQPQSNIT